MAAELLQRLPGVLADMDAAPLADSLARTTFAARAGSALGWDEPAQAVAPANAAIGTATP